jgi:phosphatidate cytidylyltransferase
MLASRVLAAAVMILALGGCLTADLYAFHTALLLHVFFLIGTLQAFREFWPLCRAVGQETFSKWGTGSGCALLLAHYWLLHRSAALGRVDPVALNLLWGVMVAAFLGTFLLSARRHRYTSSLGSLGVTCLGLIYLWFLPSFVLKVRYLGADGRLGGADWLEFGQSLLIAVLVVAKGCDLAAYCGGRLWGRRRVFPQLSPGKTLAGVVAGLSGAMGLALLLRLPLCGVLTAFSWPATLLFGLAVGFAGMMGDLSASLLKRSAGAKDAGISVPGYGGVLDVMDSLTVAGPVAYFLIPAII